MADGAGNRWNNYMGIPKHLADIKGEQVLEHLVNLLKNVTDEKDAIIITSHDERYEFEGITRHVPLNNIFEIDRFTEELVSDNMVFLYGDTYYNENSIRTILELTTDELLFFGNSKSIVAIKINDSCVFRNHFYRVKKQYVDGMITEAKGWQIYQDYSGQKLSTEHVIGDSFVIVDNDTIDFNTPEEYIEIVNG